MNAADQFSDGQLRKALELQRREVQRRPDDDAARLFLIELILFSGETGEAGRQLSHLNLQVEGMPDYVASYRELLTAETVRQGESPNLLPELIEPMGRSSPSRFQALKAFRERNFEVCLDYLDAVAELTPELRGHVDGREFEDLRNTDDLLSGVLEVFHQDRYLWVPFEAIRKLRLAEMDCPRDQLFRPAMLTLVDQREWDVYLPTVYPGSWKSEEELFQLGRDTDWVSHGELLTLGIGAQVLLIGDEELTLHDFRLLELRRSF